MSIEPVIVGIAAACLVFSLAALVCSIWAIAEVFGWKRSTHKVQILPSGLKRPTGEPAAPNGSNFYQQIDDFWG